MSNRLIIEVVEVRGKCPVHKVGDKIVIDGAEIDLQKTTRICCHALSTIDHWLLALREGADPKKLGLTKEGDEKNAYIQCPDPGPPYTNGGTVIFKCYRLEECNEK